METIIYLFKVNMAIAVFCIVYRALYRKDTFFSIRRFLLQSILLLSVFYPFIDFSYWKIYSVPVRFSLKEDVAELYADKGY